MSGDEIPGSWNFGGSTLRFPKSIPIWGCRFGNSLSELEFLWEGRGRQGIIAAFVILYGPQYEVGNRVMNYAREAGTLELLVRLALGQVETDPFPTTAIGAIKGDIIRALSKHGMSLQRCAQDREDVPIDFRFLQLLLKAAGDPDVSLGEFARGVRVGPGARLPRLQLFTRRSESGNSRSRTIQTTGKKTWPTMGVPGVKITPLSGTSRNKSSKFSRTRQTGAKS